MQLNDVSKMHESQVHKVQDVNFVSLIDSCKPDNVHSILHTEWIQSVCAKIKAFFRSDS